MRAKTFTAPSLLCLLAVVGCATVDESAVPGNAQRAEPGAVIETGNWSCLADETGAWNCIGRTPEPAYKPALPEVPKDDS
jgi:hypothetical protein